jgi:16S rRNA (cytosine1402-N4)-methyltransferase
VPGEGHIPVLAGPALEYLRVRPGGIYVDCTAGAGGHSSLIAERLGNGRLVALDRDAGAVERARARLAAFPCAEVVHSNYDALDAVLDAREIGLVDGILLDAGLSSVQLDDPARGFTFQADGPLDMRMDTGSGETARDWLARVTEAELQQVLRAFGDVKPAGRIASAMLARVRAGRMETTGDLCAAVAEALPFVKGVPDETRTVFQAVRMAVNDELRALEMALRSGAGRLRPGGRLVVIAFHSGEDRVAKHVIRELSRKQYERWPDGRTKAEWPALVREMTPGPLAPDADECRANPRAKSARLRAAERVGMEGQL